MVYTLAEPLPDQTDWTMGVTTFWRTALTNPQLLRVPAGTTPAGCSALVRMPIPAGGIAPALPADM